MRLSCTVQEDRPSLCRKVVLHREGKFSFRGEDNDGKGDGMRVDKDVKKLARRQRGKSTREVGESGLKGAVIPVDAFLGLVEANIA